MDEKLTSGVVSVLLAIIGVAVIAVLVSNKANTGSVLGAGGTALSNFLCTALSPVTGNSCGGGSSLPSISTPSLPSISTPSLPQLIPQVSTSISYDMSPYTG